MLKNCQILISFYIAIVWSLVSTGLVYSYPWPIVGSITSTFMEYRDIGPRLHYHSGVDIDGSVGDPVTSVSDGTVIVIDFQFIAIQTSGGWIYQYVHITVNSDLNLNDPVFTGDTLGYIESNYGHLHFMDGPNYDLLNPLRNGGLDNYVDNEYPVLNSIFFFEDGGNNGVGSPLSTNDIYGNMDMIIDCYDRTNNYQCTGLNCPAIYRADYLLLDEFGTWVFAAPIDNIYFDSMNKDAANNTFDMIWDADNRIIFTNILDRNDGTATNGYWNSRLVRNGDYYMCALVEDIVGNQDVYEEFITINNFPAIIQTDIFMDTEWYGENEVWGTFNPQSGKYEVHVVSPYTLIIDEWSRVRLLQDRWLVVDNGASLIIEPGADIILEPGAEIIYQNGARGIIASDFDFQGVGSCFYNRGQLTVSANVNLNVESGGLVVIDGGEFILEDNATIVFDSTSQKLDIRPGSTIRLGDSAEIIVKSYIDARGTAQDSIRFTYLSQEPGARGYWKWLKIDGSGIGNGETNMGIIKYAIVENADYGIYGYQVPNLTIENSTIRNCRVNNLYLNTSTAHIDSNLIANSGSDGVWLYNSSPEFFYNTIRSNSNAGVYCDYYSSPSFGSNTTTEHGYNVIRDNAYGISAYYYSNPFLGDEYMLEGPAVLAGYNSIYNNELAAVKAVQKCDIPAQYNWLGKLSGGAGYF